LGIISVDFNATGHLLIIYCQIHAKKKRIHEAYTTIQLRGRCCIIFLLSLVSPMKLVQLIKMS